MARSPGIRKTLEQLIKKVETLENQSFAQKLLIDELENKLTKAEEALKTMKEDPWGIGKLTTVPSVWPATTAPAQQQQWVPSIWTPNHICNPGPTDSAGGSTCTICGIYLSGAVTWTVTTTTDNTTLCLADPASESSSDVEPLLDLDISWVIPDEPTN